MCRTMKELERVVADYRSMKAMKEQIDAEVKSLEYEIIGYMDANEKLTETGNDFTIKLSTCERRTVDTKRLIYFLKRMIKRKIYYFSKYMKTSVRIWFLFVLIGIIPERKGG